MTGASESALRLQSEVFGRPDGPRVLYDAWATGKISARDLRSMIADVWLRTDQAAQVIDAQRWVGMFRAAGFVSQPTHLLAPTRPLTVYRGAPEHRSRAMAWTLSAETGGHSRLRCERLGEMAFVYTTTVQPEAVLALFASRAEHEVVVDPEALGTIERCR